MVGAVLVYGDRIIGEGWHEVYGEAHAEVNCIRHVAEADKHLISESTLYVSLEPCAHHGKTPPCTDLIIAQRIPRVIIGCRDPFPDVNGKGITRLQEAGIEVITGVEEEACAELNKRFFTYQRKHRPYIILKWAQSANAKMAAEGDARLFITNDRSNRLVHKWRSEEASILVGTRTALADDPALTTRLWSGRHPIRAVVDMDLRLPQHLKLFNRKYPTVVFNTIMHEEQENLLLYQVGRDADLVYQMVNGFYQLKVQSVIVEGGAMLLQSFIDVGMWDEIRVITNTGLFIPDGLPSPELPPLGRREEFALDDDRISIYYPL
jgi:diaminohydroxyphosphoribosylaminopyrimidine deaminase/5-amino-6-(5-phosphoribosylamino)uracil reductase